MKKVKNRQSDNAQPVFVLLMGSTQPREKNQGDGPMALLDRQKTRETKLNRKC